MSGKSVNPKMLDTEAVIASALSIVPGFGCLLPGSRISGGYFDTCRHEFDDHLQ